MKKPIVLAGGSGLIGRLLAQHFKANGHPVVVLTRGKARNRHGIVYRTWDPGSPADLHLQLEGAQAVIGLAGASVDRRYNDAAKWEIMHSRVSSTLAIGDAIGRCAEPPAMWVQLSTATIYRHAEDRPMDQYKGELGTGFSVEVARAWEATTNAFDLPRTRTVLVRCAMVMSMEGGVLPKLVQFARMGLGGRHGSGEQYVSWIHGTDLCRAMTHLMDDPLAQGVYDLAAPDPTHDAYLMEQLRALCRPWIALPQPRWLLEAGAWLLRTETELLLKSRRVVPTRLLREGFTFQFTGITSALVDLFGERDRSQVFGREASAVGAWSGQPAQGMGGHRP